MTNQVERSGRQMIEQLKLSRPDVAITITRFEDPIPWDGDGPDPSEEGFTCYTFDVTASTILNGEMIEGSASLGSCWYRADDDSDTAREIGGYLPQMIDEALEELDKARVGE